MITAGIDEVGVGPLAGPVVAAAVILDPHQFISGLADSKILSEKQREYLSQEIQEKSLAFSFGRAEVFEIDCFNILQARLLAMRRAFAGLKLKPNQVLIDGNRCPTLPCETIAIIGGDATVVSISAASIIAKVVRDREMIELHQQYPQYGFAQHKGYGTKAHLAALKAFGPCAIHRKSFRPVRDSLVRTS